MKHEHLFYLIVGCIVIVYPIVSAASDAADGEAFQWSYVFRAWLNALPYVVLVVIHSCLLIPILLESQQPRRYVLYTSALIVSFFMIAYGRSVHDRMDEPSLRHEESFHRPPVGPPHHETVGLESRPLVFPPDGHHKGPKPKSSVPMPSIIDTLIAVMLLACDLAFRLMLKHYDDARRLQEFEKAKMQQELEQLKIQISPHFFMNSLNNIHGMVEINPQKAQALILDLSGLMRYVLYESKGRHIPLAKEIEFLDNYISLMRVRYSPSKVTIHSELPDGSEASGIMIPPLLFIILVENSFKHGVDYRYKSFVDIVMTINGSEVSLSCVNSNNKGGKGDAVGGLGLDNLRKQLDIIYNGAYSLDIDETADYFKSTLTIPVMYENKMFGN